MDMTVPQAAITGIVTHETIKQIDNSENNDSAILDKLQNIENILESIYHFLQSPVQTDIYKIVPLYKTDFFGPAFIPHGEKHDHIWILTGVSTPLSVQTSMLGTFVFTVNPGVWTLIDFPDGTSYRLDATATTNQQYAYIRYTNDDNSR